MTRIPAFCFLFSWFFKHRSKPCFLRKSPFVESQIRRKSPFVKMCFLRKSPFMKVFFLRKSPFKYLLLLHDNLLWISLTETHRSMKLCKYSLPVRMHHVYNGGKRRWLLWHIQQIFSTVLFLLHSLTAVRLPGFLIVFIPKTGSSY